PAVGRTRLGRNRPRTLTGRGPAAALDLECLQPRQYLFGEQRQVLPGKIVRHSAIAEDSDQGAAIGALPVFDEPVVDLLRGAPDLQFRQEIDERVDPVLRDVVSELAVIL